MGPTFFEIAILGVLQGLTEFLPVSSDGHLALAQILFGIEEGGLALNIMLHAGTLVATAIVLRQHLQPMVVEGVKGVASPVLFRATAGGRDALVVAVASLPTAAIGLGLKKTVESSTHSPLAVGLGFLVTSLLLASARWPQGGEATSVPLWGALLLGAVQGFAVLPGVSRSGSTIALGLWLGLKRERAFELSMLMSVPAVLGAVALEVPDLMRSPQDVPLGLVGASIALVVGVGALALLRKWVLSGRFPFFALWTLPLALATLALAASWPS
ncbi:undecaprenyl-diphosphate phosphatase [Myxococcota bacterium]